MGGIEDVDGHGEAPTGHDEHHEGGHNIFNLAGQLDVLQASLCFMVLIGVTVVFEFIVEKLEEALHEAEHYRAMLDKVFKELALLGLISFIVFVFETTGALQAVGGDSWLLSFEYAHILLFFVAMAYVLQALMLMLLVVRSDKFWKHVDDLTATTLLKKYRVKVR
ncbi:unnamed protein product [Chrysoparadoxa australica]